MKKKLILFCYAFSLILVGCGNKVNTSFEDFTNNLFIQNISENTINLHYSLCNPRQYGISDMQPSLGDVSASSKASSDYLKQCISQLEQCDHDSLSVSQKLDYDVIYDSISTDLKLSGYALYDDMLSPSNGTQSELPVLLAEYDFRSPKDVDDYLLLLSDIPRYFDQIISFEKEKSQAGLFMSDDLCNAVIEQCEDFIYHPSDNILIKTFNKKISGFDGMASSEKDTYKSKNEEIVYNYVIPAYKKMISELTKLLGTGKNDLGLCYFKDGSDYYEKLVYRKTGCDDPIDKIYEAIEARQHDDLAACAMLLSQNPDLISECDKDLSMKDEDEMLLKLQSSIKDDFPSIDDTDVNHTLSYVDESLQDSLAPAFYLTAPLDDYTNNKIYINPSSKYDGLELFTTLAHEGYPGHLYQTVKSYEYGLSPIRSILNYGGYTEGWATYVEMLSYAYAGIDPDAARFLKCNKDFSLSLYAASDIGIHYYGWDFNKLCDFWKDYGITDVNALKEVQRLIISSPANYLKYYVGYLQIEKLKDSQQETLGEDYSDMEFHKAFLKIGPAPFHIIEKYINNPGIS